jgi:hypothetical protein
MASVVVCSTRACSKVFRGAMPRSKSVEMRLNSALARSARAVASTTASSRAASSWVSDGISNHQKVSNRNGVLFFLRQFHDLGRLGGVDGHIARSRRHHDARCGCDIPQCVRPDCPNGDADRPNAFGLRRRSPARWGSAQTQQHRHRQLLHP